MILVFTVIQVQLAIGQGFNFQSVIRNSNNLPVVNTVIHLKFNILENQSVIYAETQSPSTDQFGWLGVSVGSGTPVLGEFNQINWSSGVKFLRVECSTDGGQSYSELNTSIINVSAFVGPQGLQGIPGIQGPQGPAGQDGVMSYFSNFILLLNGGRNTGNGSLCLLILFDRVSKFNGIAP